VPNLSDRLRFFFRSFADFLFPPVCLGCGSEIERGLVCDSCKALLRASEMGVCPVCRRPRLPDAKTCGRCEPRLCLGRIRALGPYHKPYVGLVHALKYQEKTKLALILGPPLAALVEQDTEMREADALCPIPLHPARLRERGYNQSALLALVVSGVAGIPSEDLLVRVKNTATQTAKADDKGRAKNLEGAFALASGAQARGRRIVLVDDVMTSGATLHEAGLVLKQAGATEILGLVVAAAGPARQGPAKPGTASRAARRMPAGSPASAARTGAGRSASG